MPLAAAATWRQRQSKGDPKGGAKCCRFWVSFTSALAFAISRVAQLIIKLAVDRLLCFFLANCAIVVLVYRAGHTSDIAAAAWIGSLCSRHRASPEAKQGDGGGASCLLRACGAGLIAGLRRPGGIMMRCCLGGWAAHHRTLAPQTAVSKAVTEAVIMPIRAFAPKRSAINARPASARRFRSAPEVSTSAKRAAKSSAFSARR